MDMFSNFLSVWKGARKFVENGNNCHSLEDIGQAVFCDPNC